MAKIMGRKPKAAPEKILDVDASMQGTMVFKDPVNLRINGKFEGTLNTRGYLTIGESAVVSADIEGDDITIAGKVIGNIKAKIRIKIISPARITGDIQTPALSIEEGALFQGQCKMQISSTTTSGDMTKRFLSINEVADYLEVKPSVINQWVSEGKIPARKENNNWTFEKSIIDEWILKEKVS